MEAGEGGIVHASGRLAVSSFRHHALREKAVVEIESEWTARDRERQATGSAERTFLIPEPALSEAEGLAPKIGART